MERRVGADALVGERRDMEDVRAEPGRDVAHRPDGAERGQLDAGEEKQASGDLRRGAEQPEVDADETIGRASNQRADDTRAVSADGCFASGHMPKNAL